MSTTTMHPTALALISTGQLAPPSKESLLAMGIEALWVRQRETYSRPVLMASSLLRYRWELGKSELPHLVENRTFVALMMLAMRRGEVTFSKAEMGAAYDSLSERIREMPWPDEVKGAVDFFLFQTVSLMDLEDKIKSQGRLPSVGHLARLARSASRCELFSGVLFLALSESRLEYSPVVFWQIAQDADREMRHYIGLLAEMGVV